MFKSLDELIEELYEEFGEEFDDYLIDELMDALEELAVKYQNETDETEHDDYAKLYGDNDCECDGDCEHCKYAYEDDSDEYEYGNIYGDEDNIAYSDELAKAYKRAQEEFDKSMNEYDKHMAEAVEECDTVNHPAHYVGKIEVIDFIEDKKLNYNLGNCVKYIARAGKKHEAGMSDLEKTIEDLSKALWYLDREINTLKQHRDF